MTYELGRALLLSDAVSPDALANALFTASTEHVSLVRALLATRAIDPQRLEQELARVEAPILRHVTPVLSLMEQLPAGLCARLVAMPVRRDPRTGTIDVAVADARDPHAAEEISFFLGAPVRLVRAPLAAIEAALGRPHTPAGPGGVRALAPPMATPPPAPVRQVASTPLWGTPIAGIGFSESNTSSEPDEEDDPSAPAMALVADIPIPLSRKVFYADDIGPASQDAGIAAAIANALPAINAEPVRAMPAVAIAPVAQTIAAPPATALDAPWDDEDEDDLGDSDEDGQPILELRTKPPTEVASAPAPAFQPSTTLNELPITGVLRAIAHASARDELLELLLLGARTTTRKAALFIVKKDGFVGWSCTSDFGERDALRQVKIDPRAPSFLARAASSGSYAGAVLPNEANAPLLELLEASQEADGEIAVSCVAIKAGGRPAILLVAHELTDPLTANGTLAEIALLAGEALERIVLTKR